MRPVEFYAYHGTSEENAKLILKSDEIKSGKLREDHWLGKGSYFFREDYEQALLWAKVNPTLTNPKSVLEAKIKANYNKVLNLDTRKGLEDFKEYVEFLQKTEGIEFFVENKNDVKLVHFVFSSLSEERTWIIIRTFDSPAKIDENESLKRLSFFNRDKLHMFNQQGQQVCVRHNDAIEFMAEVKKEDTGTEIIQFSIEANRGGNKNALFKKSRRNVKNR